MTELGLGSNSLKPRLFSVKLESYFPWVLQIYRRNQLRITKGTYIAFPSFQIKTNRSPLTYLKKLIQEAFNFNQQIQLNIKTHMRVSVCCQWMRAHRMDRKKGWGRCPVSVHSSFRWTMLALQGVASEHPLTKKKKVALASDCAPLPGSHSCPHACH